MNYIDDWSSFNIPHRLHSVRYVTDNFSRLSKFIQLSDLTDDEKYDALVDYFTKYPDQIEYLNVTTLGRPNEYTPPRLMNIGGVVKYK